MYNKGQRTQLNGIVRIVESMFYRERAIERTVRELREDALYGAGHPDANGGSNHGNTSPTEIKGVKLADEIKMITLSDGSVIHWPERWLDVIHATYLQGDETHQKAVKMRYEGYKYRQICDKLYISDRVYYTIIDESRQFAIAAACQKGLIRVL